MTLLQALFLGLVQGLTEFLPISSSGHLVISQKLFSIDEPMIFFNVVLHFCTLGAIIVYFRRDISGLISSLAGRDSTGSDAWTGTAADGRRFVLWVIVGSIPAGIAGLLFESRFEAAFGSLTLVGGDLLVTGALLAAADRVSGTSRTAASLGPTGALIIGAAQAVAILPGISRSGATICAGLFLGLDRREAARFSFLLSIPAICGATVLQLKDALESGMTVGVPLIAGAVLAFISGLAALQWLIHILTHRRLIGFAIYCWLVGAAAIVGSIFFL